MSQIRNIISKNPFTGEVAKQVKFISNAELNHKIDLSRESYLTYKSNTYKERSKKLVQLSYNIEQNVDYYAEILAQEMGAPITQGRAQVQKSAFHCKYYADNMERFLKQTRIKTEARNSGVIYEPLGAIHLMVPFNYPFWLTFKAGIPILASGNTLLVRNSDSTPILAEELEKLFIKSGFDNNEFQNVYSHPEQLDQILGNKYVQGVSFTGSTRVGKIVASTAGKYLKKTILELGGSDPFIVRLDADIDQTVDLAIKSRLLNSGQTCISAKRFLIHDNVYDQFVEKLILKLQDQKVGNPMEDTTNVGPLARTDLKDSLKQVVDQGIKDGGRLLYEHDVTGLPGSFYPPTVVELKNKDNILFTEETFGPVFALLRINSDEEAVSIANESIYGLGGSVHSKDIKEAEKVARQIETGMVFVNDIVKSDSRLPAGGCKESGYGRECSDFGIKEFTNIKTYYIA